MIPTHRRVVAAFLMKYRTTCAVGGYDQLREAAYDRYELTWGRVRLVAWYVRHPCWATYILRHRLKLLFTG